jgi:hypothetical protein
MGNAYDSASLLVTPNGYKASKIYSAKPTDGTGDLAFSRASTAMRRNSAGLWEEVANNVPRLQYPIGGGCPSWLFEPQATNSVNYSNNLSLGWSNLGGNSIIVDTTTPCDLFVAQNGTRLRKNIAEGTQAQFRENTFTPTNGVTYVISFFAKSLVGTNEINIDLVDSPFAAPIPITNTWNRYEATLTATGGSTGLDIGFGSSCALNNEIVICGIQIEVGSVATSPIITAGSAVTRLADVSNTTGLSAVIGQTEGTMYWEGKLPQDQTSSAKYLLHLYGASPTIIITTISTVINILSGAIDLSVAYTAGANAKIAICYNNNGNFRVFVNGVKTNEVNTFVGAARTSLAYGSRGGAGDIQPNTTSNLTMLYTTALSDSEAIELTTI